MNLMPPNYREASAGRRFFAAVINCFCLGVPITLVYPMGALASFGLNEDVVRIAPVVLVLGFWIVSGLARSPGAMFSMTEIRTSAFAPLSRAAKLRRSSPYLLLGIVAYFPADILPSPFAALKVLLTVLFFLAAVADGAFIYFGGPSLLDRFFGTAVLQLSLPSHMMPRMFGRRIW